MPYVKHTDGFEAASANHNATNSTLGGFDQLIRCRGHYPDPEPCDLVLYAHVPDEDVCQNCTVVTEEEYDDFHSERTVHLYEHQFLPSKRDHMLRLRQRAFDDKANAAQLTRELNSPDDDAVLFASEQLPRLTFRRRELPRALGTLQAAIEADEAELEQARKNLAAPGDSVRKRRLRAG